MQSGHPDQPLIINDVTPNPETVRASRHTDSTNVPGQYT